MILNVFKKLTNPVLADGCPVGIEINLSNFLKGKSLKAGL